MLMIITKYVRATSSRGSRVRASSSSSPRDISLPWDNALDAHENHIAAAKALEVRMAKEFKRPQFQYIGGDNGQGFYTFVAATTLPLKF